MPDLCETIDYAEVQGVLFPHVAVSFINLDIAFKPQWWNYSSYSRRHEYCRSRWRLSVLFWQWSRRSIRSMSFIVRGWWCSCPSLGKFNAETCSPIIQNTNKRTCSYGKLVALLASIIGLTRFSDGYFVRARGDGVQSRSWSSSNSCSATVVVHVNRSM